MLSERSARRPQRRRALEQCYAPRRPVPPMVTASSAASAKPVWLCEPTFGYRNADSSAHRPTTREAIIELRDALDVTRSRYRALPLIFFAFHLLTAALF